MKETIAIIAALLAIVGNVPYIRAVLKGTVKPHPYTWLVGSVVSCVIFFGQVVKGAGIGALPTAASEIFTLIIFVLSIRYGFKGITKIDTFFLILALCGIIPWVLTKDPTLSVIIAVSIDVAALIPTMRKTWSKPSTEKPILYAMNVLRHGLSLFSLQTYNIATVLHSSVMVVVNSIITLIIFRKKFGGLTVAMRKKANLQKINESFYSGQFGIVLLLEETLKKKVMEKSEELTGENAIHLGGKHIPHVTLYHSKFENVPKKEVYKILIEVAKKLPIKVTFTKIEPFWEKFMFWDIEKTRELENLHLQSLVLSTYYNSKEVQRSETENVLLSIEETKSSKRYGNPLVGNLWRPHVTLGYFANGNTADTKANSMQGYVTSVAFVRIGEYGTAFEILQQIRK